MDRKVTNGKFVAFLVSLILSSKNLLKNGCIYSQLRADDLICKQAAAKLRRIDE
jgi:hypothetical protein